MPDTQDASAPQTAETPHSGLAPDAVEQLKQLAELKEQGVLTDEEFAEQKRKVLQGT